MTLLLTNCKDLIVQFLMWKNRVFLSNISMAINLTQKHTITFSKECMPVFQCLEADDCITTRFITMKSGTNWVDMSISRFCSFRLNWTTIALWNHWHGTNLILENVQVRYFTPDVERVNAQIYILLSQFQRTYGYMYLW